MEILRSYEPMFPPLLAVLGLLIGSFLNVVIARIPRDESIVAPRSHCPLCDHRLPWYENVPVLSWLWLRGRCSACRAPISPRYVFVELLTGALFVASLARFGWTPALVLALCLVTLLIPLTFIDAEHWILPFELTIPGIALGVLLQGVLGGWPHAVTAMLGAAAGFLAFRTMEWVGWLLFRKEALGAGDKYLLALVGAFLGPGSILGVVLLSSLQGSVWALGRMALTGRAAPALPPADEPVAAPGPASLPGDASTPGEAGAAKPAEPPEDVYVPTFTPAFLAPGLPLLRRLALVPYTLLFQPIPDDPPLAEGEPEDAAPAWTPGASNLPFGPWISLGAVELLLLGPWLGAQLRVGGLGNLVYWVIPNG